MSNMFSYYSSPLSEANLAIFQKVKEELRKENGGENCKWTDLEMESKFPKH